MLLTELARTWTRASVSAITSILASSRGSPGSSLAGPAIAWSSPVLYCSIIAATNGGRVGGGGMWTEGAPWAMPTLSGVVTGTGSMGGVAAGGGACSGGWGTSSKNSIPCPYRTSPPTAKSASPRT